MVVANAKTIAPVPIEAKKAAAATLPVTEGYRVLECSLLCFDCGRVVGAITLRAQVRTTNCTSNPGAFVVSCALELKDSTD